MASQTRAPTAVVPRSLPARALAPRGREAAGLGWDDSLGRGTRLTGFTVATGAGINSLIVGTPGLVMLPLWTMLA